MNDSDPKGYCTHCNDACMRCSVDDYIDEAGLRELRAKLKACQTALLAETRKVAAERAAVVRFLRKLCTDSILARDPVAVSAALEYAAKAIKVGDHITEPTT